MGEDLPWEEIRTRPGLVDPGKDPHDWRQSSLVLIVVDSRRVDEIGRIRSRRKGKRLCVI